MTHRLRFVLICGWAVAMYVVDTLIGAAAGLPR